MDSCANAMAMRPILCPKPRRIASSNFPTSATFHSCSDAAAASDSKSTAESLDLIFRKDGFEPNQCTNSPSSPPFLSGSPPCRAPNPLTQDAHFRVGKVSMVSCSVSPPTAPVRVEGFDCRSPRAVAMV